MVMCSIAEGYATWVAFVKDNNNRLNGMAPKGTNIKNKQLTTASTFHYVEAVALYIYFPQERRTPLQA